MSAPLRTLAEVEGGARIVGALLAGYRARRGETVNRRDRIAGEPAEDVDALNVLIETWADMARYEVKVEA